MRADVQGQEKVDILAQAERGNLPFLFHFVLFGPSMDWVMPTYIGEDDLYSIY